MNSFVPFNATKDSIIILKARKKNIGLPVNLTGECQHSPIEGLMTKVVSHILTRSIRLIEWIIFGLIILIAIAPVAAVARIALQTSVQTHTYVEQWQNQSHELWTTQNK